jgi:hypothetical protein
MTNDPGARPQTERTEWIIGTLFTIGGLTALIVLFNFFPGKIGITVSANSPSRFVPLLAPEFKGHLPWLNLWWGLVLLLNMVELALSVTNRYGERWQQAVRWVDLGLNLVGMFVLIRLITGESIVAANPVWSVTWDQAGARLVQLRESAVPYLAMLVKASLVFSVVTVIVKSSKKLRHMLNREPAEV